MRIWNSAIFLLFVTLWNADAAPRSVTNEDIRDAILSVLHMIRATEDKLERHEYRERILGDQQKKSLITLDKRIKLLDPVKGTLSRLDERLAAVETILMQKDERERIQMQKTNDIMESIQKNLPIIIDKLKDDLLIEIKANKVEIPKMQENPPTKEDIENIQTSLMEKIEKFDSSIKNIQEELSKLKTEETKVQEINKQSNENLERVKIQLTENENLLEKYETKLAEYNNRIDVVPINDKADDLHTNIMQNLEVQKSNVEQILSDVKTISDKITKLPEKSDVESNHNTTLDTIEKLKDKIEFSTENGTTLIEKKFEEMKQDNEDKQTNTTKSITEVTDMIETLTDNFSNSYQQIKNEIEALSKLEEVMIQTGDGVLDTKRRVEYGVQQILLEVGDLIKLQSKEINTTINDRFDNFEWSFLDKDNGALANLTANIGENIAQVWRQIGIMHQQMSASTETLNKLQNQTDVYVNGSLNVMDGMKGKVGQITSRMAEVDSNLNYLMGRLSLVTQEFNQIKTGLSTALDEIRGTFNEVQDKIQKNKGPGPHKISSNEMEPFNT